MAGIAFYVQNGYFTLDGVILKTTTVLNEWRWELMEHSTATQAESAEQVETPLKRRLKLALQVGNVIVLATLVLLYLVYAVQTQQQPVAGWVAETPVETFCRKVAPFFWEQKAALHEQVRDLPLSPEERLRAEAVAREMEAIRPTHAVVLKNKRTLLGKLRALDDSYSMSVFNGQTFENVVFQEEDLLWRNSMVFPTWELTARDYRFLLQHEAFNPYLVPPYLVVSQTGFSRVQQLTFELSSLADEFYQIFRPLCDRQATDSTIHVVLFPDRQAFLEQLGRGDAYYLVNSAGYFNKHGNSLHLYEHAVTYAHSEAAHHVADNPDDRLLQQITRHEGAHQLAVTSGVLPARGDIPFWLEEGLAAYCETQPIGGLPADHLRVLRKHKAQGSLIPWERLLTLASSERETFANSRLAYAQAWLVFHTLMEQGAYRPRFFKWLLAWKGKTVNQAAAAPDDLHPFMNNLELTPSKLYNDLDASLAAHLMELP